jgi:hypothetical protein
LYSQKKDFLYKFGKKWVEGGYGILKYIKIRKNTENLKKNILFGCQTKIHDIQIPIINGIYKYAKIGVTEHDYF